MCNCPGTHAYYKYGYPLTTTEYLLHLFQDINLPQIRSYGCVLKHIIIPYSCICPFCIKKRFFQKIKIQACLSERQGRCHDQSKLQLTQGYGSMINPQWLVSLSFKTGKHWRKLNSIGFVILPNSDHLASI